MDQKLSRVPALVGELASPRNRPTSHTWHGVTLTDEFAWLKAANWPEVMRNLHAFDPEIRAYLDAENAYCDAILTDTEATQALFLAEMKGRHQGGRTSIPFRSLMDHLLISDTTREAATSPVVCRLPRAGGPTQVCWTARLRSHRGVSSLTWQAVTGRITPARLVGG